MSEQAPERPVQQAPKKENVLTRKLGPLPTWVWVVIVAAVILLYFVWKGRSSSSSQQQGQGQPQGGFGGFLQPLNLLRGPRGPRGPAGPAGPPHTKHHHRRGDHDDSNPEDRDHAADNDRMRRPREPLTPPSGGFKGFGSDSARDLPVGIDRRHKRMGEPVPGWLVSFKTAETGQTPSLMDVANHYDTDPDAIVAEAVGRGTPSSVAWKRYVARHDWASPLPPATDLTVLAHPG